VTPATAAVKEPEIEPVPIVGKVKAVGEFVG
jgi:hypothetical protein